MSLKRVLMVISVAFGVASTADCPSYWTAYGGNCYRSFGYMTTWHNAKSRCQSEKSTSGQSAHLVSIHSAAEQEYIKLLLRTGYNFFLILVRNERPRSLCMVRWIGLRLQTRGLRWTEPRTGAALRWTSLFRFRLRRCNALGQCAVYHAAEISLQDAQVIMSIYGAHMKQIKIKSFPRNSNALPRYTISSTRNTTSSLWKNMSFPRMLFSGNKLIFRGNEIMCWGILTHFSICFTPPFSV